MLILVINCGSSSIKYQLFDMAQETVKAKGLCDRIGLPDSLIKHTGIADEPLTIQQDFKTHADAISTILDLLIDSKIGVVKNLSEITCVGHRVVHGGEHFTEPAIVTSSILKKLDACCAFAPLHNPPNILGIKACQTLMPQAPMVAVFDTSFHQTMPVFAYLYALPFTYYEKHKLRKYGFHGTSHQYVAQRASCLLQKPLTELKLISCHLGNGSSICAISEGKSVDTSMGFTPLEGLPMGTRSGSIDPAIIEFLAEREKLSIDEVLTILNKKSGMLGVSELSSDFRDLEEATRNGNVKAQYAIEMFSYRVRKYIGEYAAAMGGLDGVILTGGVGENSAFVRSLIFQNLEFLGLKIDEQKNLTRGQEIDIRARDASRHILIIPTNEELSIARQTQNLLATSPSSPL